MTERLSDLIIKQGPFTTGEPQPEWMRFPMAAMFNELRDTLIEKEATIRRLKERLPYWADQVEGDLDWSKGDAYRTLLEMRETADQL